MKRFKIHIIPALLACILALPVIFSGGLQLFQVYLKARVSYRMEQETLQTLKFPLHQVEWVEEGREIRVEGQMYDLKSYQESGGYLLAEGFADHDETRVMELLNNFNEKEQNRSIVSLLMFGQFFAAFFLIALASPFWKVITRAYQPYRIGVTSSHLRRFFPPPRV